MFSLLCLHIYLTDFVLYSFYCSLRPLFIHFYINAILSRLYAYVVKLINLKLFREICSLYILLLASFFHSPYNSFSRQFLVLTNSIGMHTLFFKPFFYCLYLPTSFACFICSCIYIIEISATPRNLLR